MRTNGKILDMRGITKDFPGVRALDGVDFQLSGGEIHALVGENGAGKSTLGKVLAGVLRPNAGTISLDGTPVELISPRVAQLAGIGMVYQEINLVPTLTVARNLFLGHEPMRMGVLVDATGLVARSEKLLSSIGVDIAPSRLLVELSVAEQQMVALARALSFNPRILILDESTSSLTTTETGKLFTILRDFKERGGSIVYISHRLSEVFEIADRITVLKDGRLVDTCGVDEVGTEQLIAMMVGRDVRQSHRRSRATGPEVLRVSNLSAPGLFQDVYLSLHEGEIVGLAGLVGSGRTEFAEALFGLRSFTGEVQLLGRKLSRVSPAKATRLGLALLPEDRHVDGLCLGLSLQSNVVAAALWKLFPQGIINPKNEAQAADKYIAELDISTPSRSRRVRLLSGGNQQKVVLAKWLCSQSKVLMFDEPTRGIDVGAKSEIHQLMDDLTRAGASILMISSELPEIVSMSDRVYVMREGRIAAECTGDEISEENIVAHML